jgi:hypothetical protein
MLRTLRKILDWIEHTENTTSDYRANVLSLIYNARAQRGIRINLNPSLLPRTRALYLSLWLLSLVDKLLLPTTLAKDFKILVSYT